MLIDLPMNWTNWSLSLLARSDLVLMVTELRVPSLHRARRQLDLLDSQDLHTLDVRIVAQPHGKGIVQDDRPPTCRARSAATSHSPSQMILTSMTAAIDRGVPIDEVSRKSALARILRCSIDKGIAAALGLEHNHVANP